MEKADRVNFMKHSFDKDDLIRLGLMAVASAAVVIVLFIFAFIITNSLDSVRQVGLWDFISGSIWRPSSDEFGAFPLITGTLLVTLGALMFALPLGLGAAIFISEIAPARYRNILKPICEVFSGIPSVVYGFFGLMVVVPFILNNMPGATQGESWLAGSFMLGIMALPTIITVSEDALNAVPRSYREASLAMGATRWETTIKVVVPAAVSGITAAIILGMGRAIGETMAVLMVTGNAAIVPEPIWNMLSPVRTLTATLAMEMSYVAIGSTHYSALFFLALLLLIIVLLVNFASNWVMRRTKRKFGSDVKTRKSALPRLPRSRLLSEHAAKIKMTIFVVLLFVALDSWLGLVYGVVMTVSVLVLGFVYTRLTSVRRQTVSYAAMGMVMMTVILLLVVILGHIFIRGLPVITIDFLTQYPSNAGLSGGIYPAIVGTVKLIIGTMAIALPLGIGAGVYLGEYSKDSRGTRLLRAGIENLNGTPSIVFGLFGFAAFVIYFGMGYSLIAGCLTLAFLILPVIIRTTEEAVKTVPQELKEASLALGASKWETVAKVVLPTAFPGIITGSILAIGRAAGETAPIMFTAVVAYQTRMGSSLLDPVMALPYHLYYLATNVPNAQDQQYGTAVVLLLMVMSIFLAASLLRQYYSKKFKW